MNKHANSSRRNHWRVFRPFAWWLTLVLGLFLIRTHQRLSEQTNLRFEPTLANEPVSYQASVTLDGHEFGSGDRVSIGWHTLSISHPKTKPFTTNLFIWYGERNLEAIPLERATGVLSLQSQPAARRLTIRGPEFSVVLTNTTGLISNVPTDRYVIEAQFKHTNQSVTIEVSSGLTANQSFVPALGEANIACNQEGASFELLTGGGRLLEQGTAPATVTEIPAGTYRLTLRHHGNQLEETATVKAGATNEFRVEFQYGALVLDTEPPGATVLRDGRRLGLTPLTLTELLPAKWRLTIEREDYEPAVAVLEVSANRTNRFQTNLVSRHYTAALRTAQDYFNRGRYDEAVEFAREALKHKADDPVATGLLRDATGFGHLALARAKGERGDFSAGITELKAALESIPDNAEAKALLADYTQREADRIAAETKRVAEQAEREQKRREAELAEQRAREKQAELRTAFNILLRGFADSEKFDEHELVTAMAVGTTGTAIKEALTGGEPSFRIVRFEQTRPDIYALQARQSVSLGYRDCFVVGSQVREGETRILFKVLEYDHPPSLSLLGGLVSATVTTQADGDGTRAAKFQAQVKDGTALVRKQLQRAIGGTVGN